MGIIDKITKEHPVVNIIRPGALNVPNNSFMNWFRDRMSAGNIKVMLNYIDSKKYKWVSEAISKQEIDSWNSATPIFISAQTGTGKNTFIKKTLLRKVYYDNKSPVHSTNDKILLLSNRIALNRQSKLQYADYLHELTGNKWYKDIFAIYSKEGIDDYIDFGIIDICSYHQLLERKLLDSNNPYKYIICDECHFFTSDSMFNNKTDDILDYIVSKGKGSIRIYMTATIETVFEAIIRSETKWIEGEFEYWEHYADTQRPNDVISRFNIQQDFNEGLYPSKMSASEVIDDRNKYIDNTLNNIKANYKQTVHFYYMSRNYDYIENVYVYENYSELVQVINDSKDKWLIFVPKLPSQNINNELKDISKISKMELSREKIDNNEKERNFYDDIIEQEKFNCDVLITTSLLDNGINISDEKVKNIVIDVFDRVEFIQMLGRVRIKGEQKINLYIKNYTIDDLKKILNNKINLLTLLLYMDILPREERTKYYDNILNSPKYNALSHNPVRMFKRSDNEVYNYNVNAIIQLIDSANYIFRLIRNVDKNYVVKLNSDDMDRLIKVRKYYAEDEGSNKFWSRSVVDLVETEMGLYDRESNINAEKRTASIELAQEIEEKYSFKFDDTFLHYLYAEMIPSYDVLNETDYAIDIAREEKYNAMRERYKILANTSNIINSLDEQIRWIEKVSGYKFLSENIVSHDNTESEEKNKQSDDELKQKIVEKIISEEIFEKERIGKEYAKGIIKFPEEFLEDKGIENDSDEADWISKNCCGNVGSKQLKNQSFEFEGHSITIRSVQSKSNETYYLLVDKEGSEHV